MKNSIAHDTTRGAADWRRLLLLAAGTLLLVLGLFALWQTWLIADESHAVARVHAAQQRAAQAVQAVITREQRAVSRAVDGMDPALLQAAPAAAAAALQARLPQALTVQLYSATLDEVLHADYRRFGYGKAAQLLAAQSAEAIGNAQSVMAPGDKARRLSFAMPLGAPENPLAWAWIELPFAPVQQAFEAVPAAGGRLELLQGSAGGSGLSLIAHGSSSAEKEPTALPVAGSAFSIGAALPRAFIVLPRSTAMAGVLALLALALGAYLLRLFARPARARMGEADDIPMPPLEVEAPAAPAPVPAPVPVALEAPPPAPARPLDRTMFRAYDIRGVVGAGINADVARQLGAAIGATMREQGLSEIVVGRDGRLSGEELAGALAEGLRGAGIDVIDIGAAPTPVIYYAAYRYNAGCAVAVTGSHNPPEFNGFKIVIGGETLAETGISDLYRRMAAGNLSQDGQGALRHVDAMADYLDRIVSDVQAERSLKVVVDCGNGIAGAVAPQVLEAIGCAVIPLYCEVDGSFPNHHPDPSEPANLEDLKLAVKHYGADLGLAFDGDGDRLGVVTRTGEIIYPDRTLMLFARDVLSRQPGATIIYDVKCTGHLKGQILDAGGSPLMWRTGHSLIKRKMRETGAELAGEMSGHFFFKERWYGFDDGIYAAARLLEILAGDLEERTPEAIFATCPKGVSTPELKVAMAEGENARFIERFREQASLGDATLVTLDGVRADWPDGWGLVRASNTTPSLVLRFDADNAGALARIQRLFREQLLAVEPTLQLPF